MNYDQFVRDNLYQFVWEIVRAFGGDIDTVNNVYTFLTYLINGALSGIFVPLLFVPIALWYYAKVAVAGWGQFLTAQLNWFSDWITSVSNEVTPLVNLFATAITDGITDFTAWVNTGFTNFYNWAGGELAAVYKWGSLAFTDVYNWITSVETAINTWVASLITGVYNYFNTAFTNSYNWVSGAFTAVYNWTTGQLVALNTWASGAITIVNNELAPLNDFMNWWRNGAGNLLTQFAANPSQLIFDLLYAQFLRWLTQVLVDNW